MELVTSCCCGLDVHKKNVVACLRRVEATGEFQVEVRTFSTMTQELLALAQWLKEAHCQQVAMERTGVYWKPIFNLLHMDFEVLVVNAQHRKAVPGRKPDGRDAEWIAELLHFGLLRGSYIPPQEQREVRELTRYRTTLVQQRARFINRLPKVLEDANVKRGAVATNILGLSARAMLEAIVAGESDPATLAELARGKLRTQRAELEQALTGRGMSHHRFLISELLGQIEYLDEAIERLTTEIGTRLHDESEVLALVDTIPGVSQRTAEILLAEISSDLSRFPSAKHLASWAGMCPGHDESAGTRRSGRTRNGPPWLRQALTEAAQAAARTKNTYLGALYRRLAARRGKKKAVLAVGHSILVSVYYILTRREPYQDLGANYFDERDRRAVERRLVRRLEQLGNTVTLAPRVPVPEVAFSE